MSKPKIAVVITGEYRTFKYCRKTMLFLDQHDIDVDIYFSTWNETTGTNPIPSIPLTRYEKRIQHINKEIIEKDLGRTATIQVLPIDDSQCHIPYLIRSWIHGCDLLLNSGKTYDYVFLLRPDLFFHPDATIDIEQLDQFKANVGVSETIHNWMTTDVNLFTTFKNYKNIFSVSIDKLISKTRDEPENGWHENWHDYISLECKLKLVRYPVRSHCHIARFPLNENSTLSDVQFNEKKRWASKLSVYDVANFVFIFDLDGVLIESKDMHFQTLNAALTIYFPQAVISFNDQQEQFEGLPTRKKLELLTQNKNLPKELYQDIIDMKNKKTWEWLKDNIKPNLDTRTMFTILRTHTNNRIAVASNSIRKSIEIALDALGVRHCVNFIISNEDVLNPKPDPTMFIKCMEHFGVAQKQTIIIEDSEVGVAAATASGAHVLRVVTPTDVTLRTICNFIYDNKLKEINE